MKRTAALFAVLVAVAAPSFAEDAVESSPYYPTKVGSTWKYKFARGVLTNKITKHEKVGDVLCARLDTLSGDKVVSNEHVTITRSGVERHATLGFRPEPPVLLLKFPLKDKDEWEIDSKVGEETIKGTAKVEKESLTIGEKKYDDVYKVTTDVKTGAMQIKSICWYAKDVGMVKQNLNFAGNEVKLELEEFKAGE